MIPLVQEGGGLKRFAGQSTTLNLGVAVKKRGK